MGWFSDNKPKGMSFKEWATKKYYNDNDKFSHEVIETGLVNRTVGYLACKRTVKLTGESYTYCMVVLIRWINDSYQNMMVKELDETVYPYHCKCPKKVFKLLSKPEKISDNPGTLKYIKDWRNDVKVYHDNCKTWSNVRNGNVITFNEPFQFTHCGISERVKVFKVLNKQSLHFTPLETCIHNVVRLRKSSVMGRGYSINK